MMRVFLSALLLSSLSQAASVSYVDENGTRHFVASEADVPEKYRETLKASRVGDPIPAGPLPSIYAPTPPPAAQQMNAQNSNTAPAPVPAATASAASAPAAKPAAAAAVAPASAPAIITTTTSNGSSVTYRGPASNQVTVVRQGAGGAAVLIRK